MAFVRFFFAFVLFLALGAFAAPEASAQQTREHILLLQAQMDPQAAGYLKIGDIKGECDVHEGRNEIGRNIRTGEVFVVFVEKGEIVRCGVHPNPGHFKPLPSAPNPCFKSARCNIPPKCYLLPDGACVCLAVCAQTPKIRN